MISKSTHVFDLNQKRVMMKTVCISSPKRACATPVLGDKVAIKVNVKGKAKKVYVRGYP